MGQEQSELVEGRLRGFSRAAVRAVFVILLLLRLLLLLAGLGAVRVAVVLQLRSCQPLAHSAP